MLYVFILGFYVAQDSYRDVAFN